MELIARGNTVARIAETLLVSENTIRTHRKQELADLVDSFDPRALKDEQEGKQEPGAPS